MPGGKRTLIDYRRLADTYDREFLTAQTKKPMANGRPMCLYHFVELATVESPETRAGLIDRVRR